MLFASRFHRSPLVAMGVIALALTACTGSTGTEISAGGAPSTSSSEPAASPAPVDAVAFSNSVAQLPAWASIKRGPPTDAQELESAATGVAFGTVVGVAPGSQKKVSSTELSGSLSDVEPVMFDQLYVDLLINVDAVTGSLGESVTVGDRVAVPIIVWMAGTAPESLDDATVQDVQNEIVADALRGLEMTVPTGARIAVLGTTATARADGGVQLVTPMSGSFPNPAAVTFEEASGRLVSLDWQIGEHAKEYFAVESLGEIAAVE